MCDLLLSSRLLSQCSQPSNTNESFDKTEALPIADCQLGIRGHAGSVVWDVVLQEHCGSRVMIIP